VRSGLLERFEAIALIPVYRVDFVTLPLCYCRWDGWSTC
jgi:hypothetical protein